MKDIKFIVSQNVPYVAWFYVENKQGHICDKNTSSHKTFDIIIVKKAQWIVFSQTYLDILMID